MEKNSRSYHHNILIGVFYFTTSIIGLIGCEYAPSIDQANKMMLQEKEKFDYLISVSKRLDSDFNQCYFLLNVDYYSYRSNFSLSERIKIGDITHIKTFFYFSLDNIGNKKIENNDSLKKYMSADLFPMFDSVIQIRKDLNCRNITINRHVVYIEYLSKLEDSTIQIIHYNDIDKSIAPAKTKSDVHENDSLILNQKDTPSGYPLIRDNWYYVAEEALHGIS